MVKEENKEEKKWEVTAKRYVAFIDIMGFKDMVARKSHGDIYKMMLDIDGIKKRNQNIDWSKRGGGFVKNTTYSDSIIIYSIDASADALDYFENTVAAIICDLLILGVPHKGAVAFGELTLDYENSIFFGQPLIDAYLLQEELAFYGMVVHATAEAEMLKPENKKALYFSCYYNCPFKNGVSNHLTIIPIQTTSRKNSKIIEAAKERSEMLFASMNKLRLNTSGHLRKYVDSTEIYLNIIENEYEQRKPK